jgi:hypothetical protein
MIEARLLLAFITHPPLPNPARELRRT